MNSKWITLVIIGTFFLLFISHMYYMIFTTGFIGVAIIILTLLWLIFTAIAFFNAQEIDTFIKELQERTNG